MSNEKTKYQQYIDDVLTNKVTTSKYIKLAVKRFNLFKKRTDIYFDEVEVERVENFIGSIRHYLGKSNGKPFILENWQSFIIANIFGWKYKSDNTRVTRKVFLFMSRKQGKTALASAIALYMLIADNEASPQIVCAANSREQAKIILDTTKGFVKSLDQKETYLNSYRNEIKFSANNGEIKVVASDAAKLDGLNLSCFIIDEYHEARDTKLIDVLSSSQGMRLQPLQVIITTAGFNTISPCKSLYDLSIEILEGLKEDESFFSMLYTLDESDKWDDEKNWLKSNPNMGVTVEKDFIKNQVNKAKIDVNSEFGIKTKILNLWVSSSQSWLQQELINKVTEKINLDDFIYSTANIGVDLASVGDLTAMSLLIVNDNKYYFKTYYFLPENSIEISQNKELYKKWVRSGELIATDGNVADYNYIINLIKEISKILIIDKIYYDSWNATKFAIDLQTEGFNLVPFSQAIGNYNKVTKEFERLIKNDEIIIDNNEITRYCFQNVVMKFDHNGNTKPTKAVYENKIDGVIAMLTALGGYLNETMNNVQTSDFEMFIIQ